MTKTGWRNERKIAENPWLWAIAKCWDDNVRLRIASVTKEVFSDIAVCDYVIHLYLVGDVEGSEQRRVEEYKPSLHGTYVTLGDSLRHRLSTNEFIVEHLERIALVRQVRHALDPWFEEVIVVRPVGATFAEMLGEAPQSQ